MALTDVIAHIDAEIAKLQQVKTLLLGSDAAAPASSPSPKSGRGRPKGSGKKSVTAPAAPVEKSAAKKKRQLSPEGRKAIAEAMTRRWAERRKTVAK